MISNLFVTLCDLPSCPEVGIANLRQKRCEASPAVQGLVVVRDEALQELRSSRHHVSEMYWLVKSDERFAKLELARPCQLDAHDGLIANCC